MRKNYLTGATTLDPNCFYIETVEDNNEISFRQYNYIPASTDTATVADIAALITYVKGQGWIL